MTSDPSLTPVHILSRVATEGGKTTYTARCGYKEQTKAMTGIPPSFTSWSSDATCRECLDLASRPKALS